MASEEFVGTIHRKRKMPVVCDTAEELIAQLGDENIEYFHTVMVRLTLSAGEEKAESSLILTNWRKLIDSPEISKVLDKLYVCFCCAENCDRQTFVEFMKDVNKCIKRGININCLDTEADEGLMTGEEVEALVKDIEDQHREALPKLGLTIRSSVAVDLLEKCLGLGWPVSQVEVKSKDFKSTDLDWEKLKTLFKAAQFEIVIQNEGEQTNWDPLPALEAVLGADKYISLRGLVISERLLSTVLGFDRWRNLANDQIKTLTIKPNETGTISVSESIIKIEEENYRREDLINYLSRMYSLGEAKVLGIENIEIILRNKLPLKAVKDLLECISNQDHALLSMSALFNKENIEIPPKLGKQIEVNLSTKMTYWIQSGTEVVYDRLKVMLIGQGRAGKSSTIRSLLKQSFDPNLQSTLVAEADKDISINVQDVSSTWEQTNKDKNWVAEEMGEYLQKVHKHVDSTADEEPAKYLVSVPVDQGKVPASEKELATKPKLKPNLNNEDVAKNVRKELNRNRNLINEDFKTQKDNMRLTIWDFGGQQVFYALHHLYLTSGGVYILVFDLSLMLQNSEEELKVLNFWLDSVSIHAAGAAVIMVGTRCNQVEEEDLKEIDAKLTNLIEKKTVDHLQGNKFSFFPIDNSDEDNIEKQIEPLRAIILTHSHPNSEDANLNLLQRKIPLNWIYFMNHLVNRFKGGITANKLFAIGRSMNLDRNKDIIPMLEFYQSAGAIIPFTKASPNKQPLISDYIVLSPEWLLKVLGSFVYDPRLHKRKESLYKDGYMRSLIINYEKTGILSKRLLLFILDEANIQQKDYGFIFQLCQEMLIMSRFDYEPEWSTKAEDTFFLVPTMNKQVSTQEAIQEEAAVEDCISIYIHFARVIPIGLFERMICVMLTCNRDFDGTTLEPTITRNFAMFCFRETEVFLVDESENRDFRLSLSKDEGSDLNIIVNLLEIGSMIQEKLQSDVLGKHITSSIQIRSVDGNGNKFSCSAEDLITAVEKGKPKVRVVPAKGRPRLKKISQLNVFAEAAQMIVERKKQKEEQEKEQNKLQWEYHCFLAHTWGPNNETHDKVVRIAELLKERNLKPWLDEANLKYFVSNDIVDGLKKSSCILVFITELYFEKVENTDTNASREFAQAVSKGTEYMVPVVLDPKCLDPKSWAGSTVGYNFSDALYFDFSSEEKIKSNFGRLCERIEEMSKAERPRTLFD